MTDHKHHIGLLNGNFECACGEGFITWGGAVAHLNAAVNEADALRELNLELVKALGDVQRVRRTPLFLLLESMQNSNPDVFFTLNDAVARVDIEVGSIVEAALARARKEITE